MKFSVGKYTLESLTSGMYLDPIVLYREYIQNALDSIDEAVETGLFVNEEEGLIEIELDKSNNQITIQDNAMGVPESKAIEILLGIGNSQKFKRDRRGFRGIGRLVGLGYSNKLKIETSYNGEAVLTKINFDCLRLRELLIPGAYENYDMKAVLSEITTVTKEPEQPSRHYLRITLEGVQTTEVIDKDIVEEYISEVAPVPYSNKLFSFSAKIHQAFEEENLKLREYKILIRNKGEEWEQVYKFNRDQVLADRQRKIWDRVNSIEINKVYDENGYLSAICWFTNTNFSGTILDKNIKGLRFRKGNILIGDENTLNSIFKEPRFNGWFQGEIFVLDKKIIPNARRDNFERNSAFINLYNQLLTLGEKLSKLIREVSAERNNLKAQNQNVNIDVSDGNNPTLHLIKDSESIRNPQNKLLNIIKKSNNSPLFKYGALNVATNLTTSEKRILEKIFTILEDTIDENQKDNIISKIIEELKVV